MKIGDPKQARILSVVAVGAVAFVIIQLMPGGGSSVGKVSQQIQDRLQGLQNSEKNADPAARKYPTMLARNVFDHPFLSKTKADSTDSADATESRESAIKAPGPSSGNRRDDSYGGVPPALPGLPPLETVTSPTDQASEESKPAPIVAKPTVITVDGVILRPSPTALISVDMASLTPSVGDVIANGYRLHKITKDGVILSRKGKNKTVPVGGSLTL